MKLELTRRTMPRPAPRNQPSRSANDIWRGIRSIVQAISVGLMCIGCAQPEQILVVDLPDRTRCAELCVDRLQLEVEVDGIMLPTVDRECGSAAIRLTLPQTGKRMRLQLLGFDESGALRADVTGDTTLGSGLQLSLLPTSNAPVCTHDSSPSEDATASADMFDAGMFDAGMFDAGLPDAAPPVHLGRVPLPSLDDSQMIFVSKTDGQDQAAGTMAQPVRTLSRGLTLARAQGKAVVLERGEYVGSGALDVSIYGNYRHDNGRWRALPFNLLALNTLITVTGSGFDVTADVTVAGVLLAGQPRNCTLTLAGPHRLTLHWVGVLGIRASAVNQIGQGACALWQTAGEVYGEFVNFSDYEGAQENPRVNGPGRAPLRLHGGQFEAVNSFLLTHFASTPTVEVDNDASVSFFGVLLRGGFGLNSLGGNTHVAQASFDLLRAAVLLPPRGLGMVSITNALVHLRRPGGAVVAIANSPPATQLSIRAVMADMQSVDCWAANFDEICTHASTADFEACDEAWCSVVEGITTGNFAFDSKGLTTQPAGRNSGIDLDPHFDGARLPVDFYGTPWPMVDPDLGWLQHP